jgi:hypothetical protein
MKRLSIFLVFIFFVSILSVYYPYRENGIFQNDTLISDTIDDSLDFSICDIYQILLSARFISIIIPYKISFTSRILPCEFFIRAPPV